MQPGSAWPNGRMLASVASGPQLTENVRRSEVNRLATAARCIRRSMKVDACWRVIGTQEFEKIWLVSFLDLDLGYFDEKEGRVEPGPNPFVAKVLTMSPVSL